MTRAQVASGVLHGPAVHHAIDEAYRTVLDRAVDPAGLAFWTRAYPLLRDDPYRLQANLAASPEYRDRFIAP